MSNINETAFPILKESFSLAELQAIYTPSSKETHFIFSRYRQSLIRGLLLIQLKLLQRLGYFVALKTVPEAVIQHVCDASNLRAPTRTELSRYDQSGSRSRHQELLRSFIGLQRFANEDEVWLRKVALQAALTKQELPDIINVLIEELVRHRYELPGFRFLSRLAQHSRAQVNDSIYAQVTAQLTPDTSRNLDRLLHGSVHHSAWDALKREPKQPSAREIASFLKHIHWLQELAKELPTTNDIAAAKRAHLTIEARALDLSDMRALKPTKRYTLAVLLIHAQLQKAMDDVADIFVKSVRNLHRVAEERLKQYHLEHTQHVERLINQFHDVLMMLQEGESPQDCVEQMTESLGDPEAWIAQCEEHLAFAGNNYYPFMLQPYRSKRASLFQCLDVLSLKSSSQDQSLLNAIDILSLHRSSRRELLELSIDDHKTLRLDDWLPEKWRRTIFSTQNDTGCSGYRLHRKYFELCVFTAVMKELVSGDLYAEASDQYDDYRDHLISWEEYDCELAAYGELLNIPTDGESFASQLRQKLIQLGRDVDKRFPENEHVAIQHDGLLIRRHERAQPPAHLVALDQKLVDAMPTASILDVLTEAESWLGLHRLFGPLSGFEAKIDDPRKRFITTLFCYGCNLGPTQTARSVKGLSRKQVAWLNLRHVTEERLDIAITKVIDAYGRFVLPRFWGSGKQVSADGTKWNVYEQNLLSEYHIRYGGYGGIGYYHVSDMYIALFSHFIPCGVHEAVYILDGLIKNESTIQPDTLHGDTQAQSAPVFGLAHLLGIKLMPRIRNIKDLIFFKPERGEKYAHINALFSGECIDWKLIARHFPDMLRVVISIKAGKITPSMILRRLGTASRKNKLYFAFRELGRVIRTMFLLNYINDIELRRTIQAATNKSEEFNNFTKWLFFGGDGIIAENIRHEQRKVIKYNHLVANLVILHNVQWMSRTLKEFQQRGIMIDEELLQALSPYRTSHLNRFGDYTLDMERKMASMDHTIKFF